jgi:hypothetical protein
MNDTSLQSAADEWNAQRVEYIDSDEVRLDGVVIGRLSDLPEWATRYIKALRAASYPVASVGAPIEMRDDDILYDDLDN